MKSISAVTALLTSSVKSGVTAPRLARSSSLAKMSSKERAWETRSGRSLGRPSLMKSACSAMILVQKAISPAMSPRTVSLFLLTSAICYHPFCKPLYAARRSHVRTASVVGLSPPVPLAASAGRPKLLAEVQDFWTVAAKHCGGPRQMLPP